MANVTKCVTGTERKPDIGSNAGSRLTRETGSVAVPVTLLFNEQRCPPNVSLLIMKTEPFLVSVNCMIQLASNNEC